MYMGKWNFKDPNLGTVGITAIDWLRGEGRCWSLHTPFLLQKLALHTAVYHLPIFFKQ